MVVCKRRQPLLTQLPPLLPTNHQLRLDDSGFIRPKCFKSGFQTTLGWQKSDVEPYKSLQVPGPATVELRFDSVDLHASDVLEVTPDWKNPKHI